MLDGVPKEESDLFLRSFLEMHRESNFSDAGHATRKRKVPMVGDTIAEAARSLIKTMWDNYGRRPFDVTEISSKSGLSASNQDLLKAMILLSIWNADD